MCGVHFGRLALSAYSRNVNTFQHFPTIGWLGANTTPSLHLIYSCRIRCRRPHAFFFSVGWHRKVKVYTSPYVLLEVCRFLFWVCVRISLRREPVECLARCKCTLGRVRHFLCSSSIPFHLRWISKYAAALSTRPNTYLCVACSTIAFCYGNAVSALWVELNWRRKHAPLNLHISTLQVRLFRKLICEFHVMCAHMIYDLCIRMNIYRIFMCDTRIVSRTFSSAAIRCKTNSE